MRATSVLLAALLALLVVAAVPGVPLPPRAVLAALVVVAGAGAVVGRRDQYDLLQAPLALALAAVLLAIVFGVFASDALPDDAGHLLAWGVAAVLVASAALASRDPPFVLAFGIFTAVAAHHLSQLPAASGTFVYVLTGLVAMGFFVFVLPRQLPREAFYWVVATVGGSVVALGLLTYVGEPYRIGEVAVRHWSGTVEVLGVETQIPVLRSVFANPNTLGFVAFAGTVAACAAAYRSATPNRNTDADARVGEPPATADVFWDAVTSPVVLAATALFVLNAVGLLLSNSRASYLAAVVALGLVAAGLVVGRAALAPTAALLGLGVLALLAGMAVGVVPVSASGRFELWAGALRALADSGWLFGTGPGSPDQVIAPFVDERWAGHSTHNSYLSVMVRFGSVGVFGYAVVVAGSGVAGSVRADVGSAAFGLGVAVHHLFEAYTLIGFGALPVLAAAAVGYALASDDVRAHARPAETDDAYMAAL